MSTDTRPPHTAPPAGPEEPAKPKIDLSLAQVLGGALAAMTAAYLGSRLSVAGTVVGAAVASIVAAVAGSVYTASLRSTQHRVRTALNGRLAGSAVPATVEWVHDRDPSTSNDAPAQPSAPVTGLDATSGRRVWGLSWKNVVVAAVAAFALAGLALTGLELATGSALSGGDGTTVSQVAEPRRPAPQPDTSASAEPSSSSPAETPTASAEPSQAETTEAEPTEQATPAAPAEPQVQPSTGATTAPAPTPTASSTASSAPSEEPAAPSASSTTADGS